MHETTPQHGRTSNAQEALTHADSTVRTTCAGIASAALAVRRALQCILRATPWKAAKASGCSFTAFFHVEKRGLKCTGCSAALRGQAAEWENQGLPARVGSDQEGRIWAVLSPGRAGGSGRWRGGAGSSAGGAGGALQGQGVHQQSNQESWIPMEVPLL